MLYLDWNFAIANTAVALVGAAFLALAYQITRRVQPTGPKIVLSAPFWLVGSILILFSLGAEMWHMFGPLINWVISFF